MTLHGVIMQNEILSSITTQIPKKWASTNCLSKDCFPLSNTTHTSIAKCSQLSIHCLPAPNAVLFAQLCGARALWCPALPAGAISPLPIEGTVAGRGPSSWFWCAFPSCSCPVTIDLQAIFHWHRRRQLPRSLTGVLSDPSRVFCPSAPVCSIQNLPTIQWAIASPLQQGLAFHLGAGLVP